LTVPNPCAAHSAQLVSARRAPSGEAGPFEYAICAGTVGASVPADGGALVARSLDERGLICNAGGALLRFGSGWLGPSEPLGRLELEAPRDSGG
jgi:hypothetical protein